MATVQKATKRDQSFGPKAGKKKIYQAPPSPNYEKQEAREAGEQQFTAKHQLTVPAIKIVFDKNKNRFITKMFDEPVNFLFDEDRKRFIYSPKQFDTNKRQKMQVTIIPMKEE